MSEDPTDGAAHAAPDTDAMAAEIAALKDQLLRMAAELDNTKKRTEREVNDARAYAITKFARDLFGVSDILDRALAAVDVSSDDPFVTGIQMTQKELLAAFERNGLQAIAPARGAAFDPHMHQAIAEAPVPGVEGGTVAEVMQCGYSLFGRTLRPAMVVVAARTPVAKPDTSGSEKTAPKIDIPDLDAPRPGDHVDQKM